MVRSSIFAIFFAITFCLQVSADPLRVVDDPQLNVLIANFYKNIDDRRGYDLACDIANDIYQLGITKNNKSLMARGLVRLAYSELVYGNWGNDFEKKLVECESLLSEKKDIAAAEFNMFTGHMLGKWRDDIPQGIQKIREAIWIAEQIENDVLLARSFAFCSELCAFDKDVERMIEFAHRAEILAEHSKDQPTKLAAYLSLIRSYQAITQDEKAVEYAREVLRHRPNSRDAKFLLTQIGEDHGHEKDMWATIRKAEARELTRTSADYMGASYLTLGILQEAKGKFDTAVELFSQAEINFKFAGNKTALAWVQNHLHIAKIQAVDDDVELLEQLVGSNQTKQMLEQQANTYTLISNSYEKVGDYENAYLWLKKQLLANKNDTSKNYQHSVTRAQEYWDSELKSRKRRRLIESEKRSSQLITYLLIFITTLALGLAGIVVTWLQATRIRAKKLTQLVDEKTVSLKEASEKAKEANLAKGEFLARVNHEIRNPLTAILAYCDLLQLGGKANQHELVNGLQASSKHLLELVDDVLVVSRIEYGALESEDREFNISDTVEAISQMMSDIAVAKHLEFDCHLIGEESICLIGDETKLRQIVLNLTSNAIKFTNTGSVRTTFEIRDNDGSQTTLHVVVTDTGAGISPKDQAAIFDQFTRVSKNEQIGGTGLGLFICKKLTDHLGGTISLESIPGRTAFTVAIPFKVASLVPNPQPLGMSQCNKNTRILVIDDQERIRRTTTLQLQAAGFDVKSSFAVDETLELIKDWKPSIVLLDLRMPNVSGFDFLIKIRKLTDSEAHIIAMTGDATDQVRNKCMEAGFDEFLTKPFRIRTVIDIVSQLENAQQLLSES